MLKTISDINIDGIINKKLCIISDIHYYRKYNCKIFDIILDNVKNNKPDYICIPGDIIDIPNLTNDELKPLYDFLTELGLITKVIISLGNHDLIYNHTYFYNEEFVENINKINNVHLLINDEYIDNDIRFIGFKDNPTIIHQELGMDSIVSNDYNTLFDKINIKDDKFNILLAHNPIYLVKNKTIQEIRDWSYLSLIVSGHTHGGLMPSFIKGHSGIISPGKRLFPKNIRGNYYKNGAHIVISAGVMKLSNAAGLLHKFNFLYPVSIDYINIKNKH